MLIDHLMHVLSVAECFLRKWSIQFNLKGLQYIVDLKNMKFLRYPGGKRRLMAYIAKRLPAKADLKGRYLEPFVGGGAVFFYQKPENAFLSDLNSELIDLYRAIRLYPHKVWETFSSVPEGKASYYQMRDGEIGSKPLYYRAARTLYLNRTCFKGMWRHNPNGKFNVGYGGEDRRWVVNHENIIEISKVLKKADIQRADFSEVFETLKDGDFVFLDPPYKPGKKDLTEQHYINGQFAFADQERLATKLRAVSGDKNIKWLMTNSAHPDIRKLYKGFKITKIPIGTGPSPGILNKSSNEILISNY
jgi:DNA adenine methylase